MRLFTFRFDSSLFKASLAVAILAFAQDGSGKSLGLPNTYALPTTYQCSMNTSSGLVGLTLSEQGSLFQGYAKHRNGVVTAIAGVLSNGQKVQPQDVQASQLFLDQTVYTVPAPDVSQSYASYPPSQVEQLQRTLHEGTLMATFDRDENAMLGLLKNAQPDQTTGQKPALKIEVAQCAIYMHYQTGPSWKDFHASIVPTGKCTNDQLNKESLNISLKQLQEQAATDPKLQGLQMAQVAQMSHTTLDEVEKTNFSPFSIESPLDHSKLMAALKKYDPTITPDTSTYPPRILEKLQTQLNRAIATEAASAPKLGDARLTRAADRLPPRPGEIIGLPGVITFLALTDSQGNITHMMYQKSDKTAVWITPNPITHTDNDPVFRLLNYKMGKIQGFSACCAARRTTGCEADPAARPIYASAQEQKPQTQNQSSPSDSKDLGGSVFSPFSNFGASAH